MILLTELQLVTPGLNKNIQIYKEEKLLIRKQIQKNYDFYIFKF